MGREIPVVLTNRVASLSCGSGGVFERWKKIPGFDSYKVSSLGRVKRVKQDKNGNRAFVGKILKPQQAGDYLKHSLVDSSGTKKQVAVHVLVARAFLGPRPSRKEVNHKDTCKRNNKISNLEYRTKKQNMEHAVANGLTAKGERHGKARLTEEQVLEIRRAKRYSEARKLAKKFGVSIWAVEDIWYRKTWKHL